MNFELSKGDNLIYFVYFFLVNEHLDLPVYFRFLNDLQS